MNFFYDSPFVVSCGEKKNISRDVTRDVSKSDFQKLFHLKQGRIIIFILAFPLPSFFNKNSKNIPFENHVNLHWYPLRWLTKTISSKATICIKISRSTKMQITIISPVISITLPSINSENVFIFPVTFTHDFWLRCDSIIVVVFHSRGLCNEE